MGNVACVWRADGYGDAIVLRGHKDWVSAAEFSPNATQIVTASGDRTARVWQADGQGGAVMLRGHEDWVSSASFSPDGMQIVTASAYKTVRVWPADDQGEAVVLRYRTRVGRRAHLAFLAP